MNANSMCVACMLNRQEKSIRAFTDERKKSEYIRQVLKLLYDHAGNESTPWLSEQLDTLYQSFWGDGIDYAPIKHKYNQLLLSKEAEVERRISKAPDPVKECIKYVCAGNYIDFGAVNNVNEDTFEALWEKAAKEQSDYIEHLKTLPPEQIIDRAYEKVMRDDILITFEDDSLSDKQVEALAKLDYPLSVCYDEWQKTDVTYMDRLRDVVDDVANDLIKQNEAEKQNNKKMHEPER